MTAAEPAGNGRMRHALEQRLAALRGEYDTGQATLAELERQEAFLRERLLMLRGAVQALDDLHTELGRPDPAGGPASGGGPSGGGPSGGGPSGGGPSGGGPSGG
jgi:hypothetical protein